MVQTFTNKTLSCKGYGYCLKQHNVLPEKITYFFLATSSGVPGVLQGCCLSGMLGVIKLFLDGRLELLGTGVLGVLRAVLGVFAFCCAGVFRGVFWDDFALDGVLVAGFPGVNKVSSYTSRVSQKDLQVSCAQFSKKV